MQFIFRVIFYSPITAVSKQKPVSLSKLVLTYCIVYNTASNSWIVHLSKAASPQSLVIGRTVGMLNILPPEVIEGVVRFPPWSLPSNNC